jgi:predicted nucleic acid-binding protein
MTKALYIETSAILSWLFGESGAHETIEHLNNAESVITSRLSIIETERSFIRAASQNLINETQRIQLKGLFAETVRGWYILELSQSICTEAVRMFPIEPVRGLDALHLASILHLLPAWPDISVLSFDRRIIDNSTGLGIALTEPPV